MKDLSPKEPESRRMDLKEFQDSGFLLEANRQFFHPLGLALSVRWIGDIPIELILYDYRDDPEGVVFASLDGDEDRRKHAVVMMEFSEKFDVRMRKFGWHIQPIGSVVEPEEE